jgi:hypothetical protein
MIDEVRSIVGQSVPLQGVDRAAARSDASESGALPVLAFSPAPQRSSLRRNFVRPYDGRAAAAPIHTVSMGMRILAIMLRDPNTSTFFDPSWLDLVQVPAPERDAIEAVIGQVQQMQQQGQPVERDALIKAMRNCAHEPLLAKAGALDEHSANLDAASQLAGIVNFLRGRMNRENRLRELKGVGRSAVSGPAAERTGDPSRDHPQALSDAAEASAIDESASRPSRAMMQR